LAPYSPNDPEINSSFHVKKESDIRDISSLPTLNRNLTCSLSSALNADAVQDIPVLLGKKGED